MMIPGLLTHLAPHGVHVCMVRVKEVGGLLEITISHFSILFQKKWKGENLPCYNHQVAG